MNHLRQRGPRRAAGFTLMEVLIVAVIITILASIAIPNYTKSMERMRRTTAMDALMRIAAEQEKFFLQANEYTDSLSAIKIATKSEGDYYDLALTATQTGTLNTGFTATATVNSSGGQADDDECTVFSIDQAGRRTAENAEGGAATDACWR